MGVLDMGIKKEARKIILTMHHKAHMGHIGSSLSCIDILLDVFFNKMKGGDKFILSKGHAATALYTALFLKGLITQEDLDTFHKDGTSFAAHPPCNGKIPGVIFGTGSLGHGLSLATGIAFADKFMNGNRCSQVYCLLGDGDCQEGQTYEATLFAKQHKLDNLHILVDHNRLQGLGKVHEILDIELFLAMIDARVYHTIKGSGVSFMENKFEWHYLPMTDEQYKQAMEEQDEETVRRHDQDTGDC
jgi:transketolase